MKSLFFSLRDTWAVVPTGYWTFSVSATAQVSWAVFQGAVAMVFSKNGIFENQMLRRLFLTFLGGYPPLKERFNVDYI